MVSDRALWQAINAHDLDAADAALPFSRRLMRETGWTHDFSQRAIHEYKAFIYLVCTAGTTLTPSDHVDQVWHLHLLYTRDYWERFCDSVLKRRIHHSPTEGGAAEDARYREAYERTRSLYRAEFGLLPPGALWPDADIGAHPAETSANASEYIHLPKRQVFLCLAGVGLALLTGCAPETITTLWRTHHLLGLGGLAGLWWLWMTLTNYHAIRRKGLIGYLFGSALAVPVLAAIIHAFFQVFRAAFTGWADDWAWGLSAMLATALWQHTYLSPQRKGGDGGSGCGSGCGSSGGHGGGGCGGHGCGSGCGGH